MSSQRPPLELSRMEDITRQFGERVRARRVAMGMKQEDLAMANCVGRRFIIDLESGKPKCYLGYALLVSKALGLSIAQTPAANAQATEHGAELPDLPDMEEEDDNAPRIF